MGGAVSGVEAPHQGVACVIGMRLLNRVAGLALKPEETAEVIAEVAAHPENISEEMLRQGITEEEAVQRALSRVGDWRDLKRKILAAEGVNKSWRNASGSFGFLGSLRHSLDALPGSASETRIATSRPRKRPEWHSVVYAVAVLAAFFGALGAYLSSRAGGSRGTMLLASVFPALAFTFAFLVMSPLGWSWERITGTRVDFDVVAAALLRDGVGWLLFSGAALLIGGLLAQLVTSPRPSSQEMAIV